MVPSIRLSTLLRILCLGLYMVSSPSFALSQKVLEQSAETINIGLIALGCLLSCLIVFLLILKIKLSRSRKLLDTQNGEISHKQRLLNDFKVGILHLNNSAEVVFANQIAASFLGSKEEKLLGQSLIECFDSDEISKIADALSSNKYASIQTYLTSSKRHLHLGFSKQTDIKHDIAYVVSLVDVTNFQVQLDDKSSELGHIAKALEQNQLGQLTIDFEKNSFAGNELLSNMLGQSDTLSGELKELNGWVDKADLFEWEQALERAKKQHRLELSCQFLLPEKHLESSGSEPKEAQIQKKVPLQFYGLSRNENDKGETTSLHILVHDLTTLHTHQKRYQASQQQVKTLLATSPNPVYVLDTDAKFIDCNSAFEHLFRHKLSKIGQKHIEELNILPKEITKLHTENNTTFGGLNIGHDKEFELKLADDKLHTLKLKLKFFADNNNNRAGVIGVLQDITELKEVKVQLEQERKHFTTILDLAPVAVATVDAEDKIVSANIAMTDRLGLTERELKKGSFYQLFSDPINAGKAAKQIHQTGRLRGFQAKLKGKNEDLHPSELHVDLLNKEKQEYLCWISDRTGEQFQQDKFEGLLQHSSMPMAILGEEGFSQLNPAACEFFQIEDEEELFSVNPYSEKLNKDEESALELERYVTNVKLSGQAKSFPWEHIVGSKPLPCHATYIPMYKGKAFDSILCLWMDQRDIQEADEARIEALNLRQEAEQQVVEKQQMLQSSQEQLATKLKTLADTEIRLQAAQEDLSEKQTEFTTLQQAHQSVTDNLQKIQQEYNQSREMLDDAQSANTELTAQLEESTAKVTGLQAQRNQISDALQRSEKKYKTAQQDLIESERNTENLKQQQISQQAKMEDFVAEIGDLKQSIEQKDQQINEVGGQISSLQSQLASSGSTSEKLRRLLINQRKASEEAEEQRRTLEQTYKIAESELSTKVRHVEHLQNEMQKFEEMSNQQKGDMEKQQTLLKQELEAKQKQLQETQKALDETKHTAEQEKIAKQQQQNRLQELQIELEEMEGHSQQQQQKMAKIEQDWQAQQLKIQQELEAKQQQLQETEQALYHTKQQGEAEKAEKERQQALFEKLQNELVEMEQTNASQQKEMAERDEKWQQQQQKVQEELKAKQQQLQETEQSLSQAKQQTKAEKQQQQALFEKLQSELAEMEEQNVLQQQKMAESDKEWKLKQQKAHEELTHKQQQLQQTEQALTKTKQQTEAEKAEKEQQQALFEKLQGELAEMEQRSAAQQQKINQTDKQWQQDQHALKDEVEAKRQQLQNTQDKLNEIQRQADAEKLARLEQQQKLEQLTVELTDVESRASKQREMIEGSDEQWRKHHAEIEQQKLQLQQALVDAEKQNEKLQHKLEGNLQQLQKAESQVSETQSGEQKLLDELNNARRQADELQERLKQQEQQESKLQQQLVEQQKSLQGSEQSIHSLEAKQAQLTEELQAVQKEYSSSKNALSDQHSDHAELAKQLKTLEKELQNSKAQLDDKEHALQDAQQQIQSNQAILAEQESALLAAHKEELQQAQEQQPEQVNDQFSAVAELTMPDNPSVWFDLLPYLQNQNDGQPLSVSLSELMEELNNGIQTTDKAVDEDDVTMILRGARRLAVVANKVNSAALTDVVSRLEEDCRQGLVDNISISWPTVKRSLNNTLRVIYAQLNN